MTAQNRAVTRRAVLAGLGASGICAAAPPLRLAAAGRERAIDHLIAAALETAPYPGVAAALESRGRVVYRKAFGFLDVENRVPATPEAVFPIGSITKTMTGLLVMQEVAAGKIDLARPVSHYLPDLPRPAAAVPVRHLLDHTSGIANYIERPDFPWASQRPFTREEMVGWFAGQPLLFAPGTRYSYTNSGFYLLGLILEKVAGAPFPELLRSRIFEPFGMSRSSAPAWQEIVPNRARGYVRGPAGLLNAPRYDPLVPFAAGAAASTLDDLLAWRRAAFGPQTSAGVRRLVLARSRLPSGTLVPYTQGCLGVAAFEGRTKLYHPGDIFGFSSQYAYYPDDDLTIVVLTNMQGGRIAVVSLEQKIARVALGRPPLETRDLPLLPALARNLAGDYEVGEIRFGLDRLGFVRRDGALALVPGGSASGAEPLKLRHQGGGVFASPLDDEQRFAFAAKAGGVEVAIHYYGAVFTARKQRP